MADLKRISNALIEGNEVKVKEFVREAVNEGIESDKILNEGLLLGMKVVGERFKNGEIFIPEVLVRTRAMHACLDILEPFLVDSGSKEKGIFLIGTVQGDLHDIGKNLVAMMIKGAHWKVIDVGVNVSAEQFIITATNENADVIGLSALLTTTMGNMERIIELAKQKGCKAKIIVGGAPLTQSYANSIRADGYASNAAAAVDIINSFCSQGIVT